MLSVKIDIRNNPKLRRTEATLLLDGIPARHAEDCEPTVYEDGVFLGRTSAEALGNAFIYLSLVEPIEDGITLDVTILS